MLWSGPYLCVLPFYHEITLENIDLNLRCLLTYSALQIIIACRKGGTSIEDLAEKFPDMIVKVIVPNALFSYFDIAIETVSSLPCCIVKTVDSPFISDQVPIDVFQGITDEDAAKVVDGLAPKVADRNASIEQVKKLYKLFCECDCTLLEVSINSLFSSSMKIDHLFDNFRFFYRKNLILFCLNRSIPSQRLQITN